MGANLQEQVDGLEARTDSLENILGQFISSMNQSMIRMEAETKSLKEEIRDFKEEIRDEMRSLKREIRKFKEEDGADKHPKTKKAERSDGTKSGKKIGRLDDRIRDLAEDMVLPAIPEMAKKYFGDVNFKSVATRFYRRKSSDRKMQRLFDMIAVSDRRFFVCEVKSNPRPEHAKEFSDMLGELPDYFPETRGRETVPVFASLHIPEDLEKYLTRMGIYAMGMREDTMDLLNFEKLRERRRENS